jgi:hypothetical protein
MKTKTLLVNLTVVAGSLVIGLLLCEVGARLILHSADYLTVEVVPDPVMGGVPSASSRGGFDAWGFRNRAVPTSADIVAIGDSHTYGNTATMEDSWPLVLGRLSGRSVYNMGLGGYGPNQYFELFKTRALSLKPRTVVLGLYMGDDFENAFLITYGLEHWAYLRELPPEKVNFDIWQEPPAPSWHKKMRVWLSRHSVLYQLIVHGPLLGRFQGDIQVDNALKVSPGLASLLVVPEKNIREAFLPVEILRRLNQQSDSVREGMRITFKLLAEMNEICRQQRIQFLVAVIPTKETVFSKYLEHNSQLPLSDVLDRLIANERIARDKMFAFFAESDIAYVDTLPGLQQSVGNELYARLATDMHPSRNGYRVIAEEISAALQEKGSHK